jgi:RNA polymerase sigma-70 factor (ECF subfamily)
MRTREERQAHFHLVESSESSVRLEMIAQIPGPEDELGDKQLETLSRKRSRESHPCCDVMVLSDIEHLPLPDVAARLGPSVAAAKSRLVRARVELPARLKCQFEVTNCGFSRTSACNRCAPRAAGQNSDSKTC